MDYWTSATLTQVHTYTRVHTASPTQLALLLVYLAPVRHHHYLDGLEFSSLTIFFRTSRPQVPPVLVPILSQGHLHQSTQFIKKSPLTYTINVGAL